MGGVSFLSLPNTFTLNSVCWLLGALPEQLALALHDQSAIMLPIPVSVFFCF